MKILPLVLASVCLCASGGFGLTGERIRDGEVAAELAVPFEAVAPGQTVEVGVRFLIDDGWHIYWRNPGDTGQTTYFEWNLPGDAEAGDLRWPHPEVYRNAHLVDFVYSGEATLIRAVSVPEDWPTGKPFPVRVKADWLMCAEICIPGSAELSLDLPVVEEAVPDEAERARFESTRAKWPADDPDAEAVLRADSSRVQVEVRNLPAPADPADLFFFPVDPVVAPGGEQRWTAENGVLAGGLVRSEYAEEIPGEVRGVLVNPAGWPNLDGRKALAVTAERLPGGPVATAGAEPAGDGGGLAGLLALAFGGGVILNLMPCVFPVLGLKVMGFVRQAGNERRKIIAHGVLFTLGVLVSFWILAGALIALRAGGEELGWGFQLQSPGFVFGMAAFLLLFALNLSGVFEIGFGIAAAGSRAEKGEGPFGSFLAGVLATVVATPCSAPFLATALAGALTLPPLQSVATFTFIALGLAAPYLLLSLFPSLLRKLPKPGAWMETFKQFMAFPLYATVGWLVYVLAGQADGENLLEALLALTGLALAAWIFGRFAAPHRKPAGRRLAAVAAALLLGVSIGYGVPRESEYQWIPWSRETVETLREDDRIVYVDFTARWCATCQVNKEIVFGSGRVREFVRAENVALVKADWTNEDPAITKRLLELGKAAVPVNLVYLPDRPAPIVLPETLTPGIVLEALQGGDVPPGDGDPG